jgi:Raf kinase inhibitor-like YbhB/YbcL family protein
MPSRNSWTLSPPEQIQGLNIMTWTIVFACSLATGLATGLTAAVQQDPTPPRSKLQITSSAFGSNAPIPSKYTCDGQNVNPPLTFASIPPKAQSLVLIVDDPDVPKNLMPSGVFDHWLIWDLPGDIKGIAEAAPEATRGLNSKGQGYTGPCPPDREHRYFFRLYALDTKLSGAKITTKQDLEAAMKGHVLEQAELVGRYVRTAR